MNGLIKFAIAAIGGLGVGLISAQKLVDGYEGFFNKQHGSWTSWPGAGTRGSNPYVRAHYLAAGRLPISHFEINELEARVDANKRQLDSNCTYIISGTMPKTRWWSLYSVPESGDREGSSLLKTGISSQSILTDSNGRFEIKLSSEPQTGNWIVPAGRGDFVLMLRFYNPQQSIINQYTFENLPLITRKGCR